MTAAPNLIQKQGQNQTQTVAFTTQMQEAIALLELSNLDLHAHIEQKILENPFLELEGQGSSTPDTSDVTQFDSANDNVDKDASDSQSSFEDRDQHHITEKSIERSESSSELYSEMESENYDNVWTSDRKLTSTYDRSEDHGYSRLDHIADTSITLRDHIQSQINTDINDPTYRFLASSLLDHLDETGYFKGDLEHISQSLGCEPSNLMPILQRLQQFDPAGVFATSLRDCMELQLRDRGQLDDVTQRVLNYIDLFAEARIEDLLKKAKCTPQDLKRIIEALKSLDPKPGLQFSQSQLQIIAPDVFVTKSKGESSDTSHWVVTLNAQTLPKVLVVQDYKIRANLNLKKDRDLKQYYQTRMAEANWLVRSLDQRAQNILKIVENIIKQQGAFFDRGVTALKPMTLKQVADDVGVHESTVSRITQNKYLQCPRGMFELRYFFSSSITNAWTGEDQSARQIQDRITKVIADENPQKPFSDDAIVLKLADFNLDVARRTVAKYREILNLPSSYERKRRHKQNL